MDFTTQQDTPELTPAGADDLYARTTHNTFGDIAAQAPFEGPTGYLAGAAERGQQPGSSGFDQYVAGMVKSFGDSEGMASIGQQVGATPPDTTPALEEPLPADVINKRYAPKGTTITDKPMTESLARVIGQQKTDEMDREGVWDRFSSAHGGLVNFGAGVAASMLDPLNVASMFVPGLGEETIAARLGEGVVSRVAARSLSEASAVAASQAPLIALKYGLGTEQDSDYTLRAAFSDFAFAAASGAAMGLGRSALRETGILRPDHLMQPQIDDIVNADPITKHEAQSAAVAQVLRGEPIDVTPIFDVKAAQSTEAELRQWAVQRQRIDTESAVTLAQADKLGNTAEAAAARASALESQLADLRTQQASFHAEAEPLRGYLEDQAYEGTRLRIEAVDAELAGVIPAARRADLEAQRTMLTEGAGDVTQQGDQALEIARTAAQVQGLETAAGRVAKTADKTETAAVAARAKADAAARTASRTFAIKSAAVESKERIVQAMAARSIRRYAGRVGAALEAGEADRLGADIVAGRADIGETMADLNRRATGNPYFTPEVDPTNTTVAEGANTIRQTVGSPAELAQSLIDQEKAGYSPGMTSEEFKAADEAVYGPKVDEPKAPKPGEPLNEADREAMLAREQELLADPNLRPEDRAELEAANAEVERAQQMKDAYDQAGACLTGAGI